MTNLDDINKLFDFQFVGGDDEFIDAGFEAPDGTVQNEEGKSRKHSPSLARRS
ncbi:hypothetical protein ACN2XU_24135 [Primorskyibacter sp. 2E107]|uniref:hypothetical protein n=1 Tax=Primorskyibacter sp. 2E107 TaxID=3403458 RepID=UPI003AF53340